jgi:hypothetical protein
MDVVSVGLTALVTAVGPLWVALLSYRQASEANRATRALEARKVDAEAYASAQAIYKDAIATLEAQLVAARARITELERRVGP